MISSTNPSSPMMADREPSDASPALSLVEVEAQICSRMLAIAAVSFFQSKVT